MAMAMCRNCGGTIKGGQDHKCPPIPFNVLVDRYWRMDGVNDYTEAPPVSTEQKPLWKELRWNEQR